MLYEPKKKQNSAKKYNRAVGERLKKIKEALLLKKKKS